MTSRQAIIQVVDDLFAPDLWERALAVVSQKRRYFGHSSGGGGEGRAPSRGYGGLRVTLAFKLGPTGAST